MNKKRALSVFIITTMMIAWCSGCGSVESADNRNDDESEEITSVESQEEHENVSSETVSNSVSEPESSEQQAPVRRIDPFEGLDVQFDGISPYVNLTFNNSKCCKEVQDFVTFTYDKEQNYANGDSVVVKAEYNIVDLEGTDVEFVCDEKEYGIEGMPYYVEDFSTVNCEALDTEIQQFMDSHYLFSNKNDRMMEYKKSYGSYISAGIMGVNLDTPHYFFFESFNSSDIEGTYSMIIKPNYYPEFEAEDEDSYRQNEKNTFNYYFKKYKNNYFVRENTQHNKPFEDEKQYSVDIYSYIYIKNIIAYPDGTLKYDNRMDYYSNELNEQAYFDAISCKGDKYNINEVK